MQTSPPLSVDAIRSTLDTRWLGHRIELRDAIGSTSREAVTLAQAGVEHGTVVVADSQTEGRGRLSRHWFSPPGVNLYCSIVLAKPTAGERLSDWLSWLPLITALAAAEAIETIASATVGVKWPNDLLVGERKVGGILCESGISAASGSFQVIGIGLNVNGLRADFPEELREAATTIRHETSKIVDRNRLLAQLLHELEECVEEFHLRGAERLALAYRRRCTTLGKTVKATLTDGIDFVALAQSIGQDGSLVVLQHSSAADGRSRDIHHLRAADIVHLRT